MLHRSLEFAALSSVQIRPIEAHHIRNYLERVLKELDRVDLQDRRCDEA